MCEGVPNFTVRSLYKSATLNEELKGRPVINVPNLQNHRNTKKTQQGLRLLVSVVTRVSDPHPFNADPDPAFYSTLLRILIQLFFSIQIRTSSSSKLWKTPAALFYASKALEFLMRVRI
jgi:hypothetical protein